MKIEDLIRGLGGSGAVAKATGQRSNTVSNWVARGAIPAEHYLPLWRMALEAGLPWEPPGAADLRPLLANKPAEAA